jgi:putative ABC transport system ATP-binding protein
MTTDRRPAVRTDAVWKIYEHDGIAVEAVRDVTLRIERGEFVVLAGPSGSGKTTLLNLLGGLTRPTRGRVWIDEQDITDMTERKLAELRLERLGFVFQAYNLLPVLTALENAEFTLLLRGRPEAERQERVRALFEKIGIGGLEDRRPGKLSGGQQQRVAVARALVNQPKILLADEPTGALDSRTSVELMALFQALNTEGTTVIIVTHDADVAAYAKRLIRFLDGRVIGDQRQTPIDAAQRLAAMKQAAAADAATAVEPTATVEAAE